MKKSAYSNSYRSSRRAGRMVVRCVTALLGGYVAAAAIASLAARLLPVARSEASAWGMILSFLVFASFGLWAFHERRLAIVAAVIWGSALLTTTVVFLLGPRG